MGSEYRKENMILYHKGYMMIPLLFAGFAAVAGTAVAGATAVAGTAVAGATAVAGTAVAGAAAAAGAVDVATGLGAALIASKAVNKYKYNRSKEELVTILQRNLANIRIIAGLNADYYAKNMDVTRQAISQIENGKVKMSKQSGFAWTTVVQIMANRFPDNLPLQKVCNLILYGLNDYSNEELKEFEETIDRIVKAKKAGLDDKTLELLASNLPDIKVK